MRFLNFLLVLFLFSAQNNLVSGQKIINGRVLDEDLEPLPGAFIFNQDTIKLVETNGDGFFELTILPESVKKLIFGYVGCEWTTVILSDDCNYLEVILLYAGTYDFMSSRKIDRLRKKAFDRLGELHHIAFTRGLFKKDSVCYTREFIPEKPNLDRISKWMSKQVKQNKKRFSDSKIGDTIKIPFSASFNCDGTKRTCLIPYSYFANMEKYDCIINGQILSKNRHKGFHNIVFKVIDCNSCIKPSPIFDNKEMVPGAIFEYDIVFHKVLN
jgi:hypothetical protein